MVHNPTPSHHILKWFFADDFVCQFMNKIPENLIVFFHDKAELPDKLAKSLQSTLSSNADFKLHFLNDQIAKKLVEESFPHLLELYSRIRIPAARSDVARLVALYKFGGVYVDIGISFVKPISELISPTDELLLVRRNDNPFFRGREQAAHFINGIIGVRAQSPFILDCLKRAYFNLCTGYNNYNVVAATGPHMITETYFQFDRTSLPSIKIIDITKLIGQYIKMHQAPGVSNMWVTEQRKGVIAGIESESTRPQDVLWADAVAKQPVNPKIKK